MGIFDEYQAEFNKIPRYERVVWISDFKAEVEKKLNSIEAAIKDAKSRSGEYWSAKAEQLQNEYFKNAKIIADMNNEKDFIERLWLWNDGKLRTPEELQDKADYEIFCSKEFKEKLSKQTKKETAMPFVGMGFFIISLAIGLIMLVITIGFEEISDEFRYQQKMVLHEIFDEICWIFYKIGVFFIGIGVTLAPVNPVIGMFVGHFLAKATTKLTPEEERIYNKFANNNEMRVRVQNEIVRIAKTTSDIKLLKAIF